MAHVIPLYHALCSFFFICEEILLRPMKFHRKLIENEKGATLSPMSLQTASQVTRDYSNRYVFHNFRYKHATNEIR